MLPRKKEERSGPYLFPPLQLTKDALKALMHVVKLGGKREQDCNSDFCLQVFMRCFFFFLLTTCKGKCLCNLTATQSPIK